MTPRMTVFKATLVQDSALSVSGLDGVGGTDRPFTIINGQPVLSGRGLKGAALAMAQRFFDHPPRCVYEPRDKGSAYQRSAWLFANANPESESPESESPKSDPVRPRPRVGVGIRHKTGARADGVLYDREVIPAGTRWPLEVRVDWSLAGAVDAEEAEGILGYVLNRHWAEGRCWLGGDVARGLGWCHIDGLATYRLDQGEYDRWVTSGREDLPEASHPIPVVEPTKAWCFRTLDVTLSFGEYRPDTPGCAAPETEVDDSPWGVDMLAIGPHDAEGAVQRRGDGKWSRPAWAPADADQPDDLITDRTIVMEGKRPLLPGSSLRGALRHAFSRATRQAGGKAEDPHPVQGDPADGDLGGKFFGTVKQSSRVLIRDGRAEADWAAARLQMHAEDEFSAGSYMSAKRDAVRVLSGRFPMRIVVEGPVAADVDSLVKDIDRLVALGRIGHLPVGGHKTRGAGWGRWEAAEWTVSDVQKARDWAPAAKSEASGRESQAQSRPAGGTDRDDPRLKPTEEVEVCVTLKVLRSTNESSRPLTLTIGQAAELASKALGSNAIVAWWCEPTIDLGRVNSPTVFGFDWPNDPKDPSLQIDEVAFFAERAVWRAARTASGIRWVEIVEVDDPNTPDARQATVTVTPARLHNDHKRFSAAETGGHNVLLREWRENGQILGFTLAREAG